MCYCVEADAMHVSAILQGKSDVSRILGNEWAPKCASRTWRTDWIQTHRARFATYNGLANSRFDTLLFGINRLRSDQKCDGFCGPFVEPRQKLSIPETQLYKAVTDNVREGFNRAYALANEKRAGTVGFALTILQRRLQAIEVGVVS